MQPVDVDRLGVGLGGKGRTSRVGNDDRSGVRRGGEPARCVDRGAQGRPLGGQDYLARMHADADRTRQAVTDRERSSHSRGDGGEAPHDRVPAHALGLATDFANHCLCDLDPLLERVLRFAALRSRDGHNEHGDRFRDLGHVRQTSWSAGA